MSMNNLKYKALALDLDGTLTDSNKNIPSKNKAAVQKAMDLGVKIILISGRPVMGIAGLAKELEFEKRGGIIAAFNGGKTIDCKTGNIIQQLFFPKEIIADACDIVRKHGAQPLSYTNTQIVAETDTDPYVLTECKCNYTDVKKVPFLPICDSFFAESYFLELAPKGVAKDKALSSICKYLNISQEEVMACGDGLNDIPMLEYAGLGIAMKNAYPETLEKADDISPYTNDECGVAWAIEKFILDS